MMEPRASKQNRPGLVARRRSVDDLLDTRRDAAIRLPAQPARLNMILKEVIDAV